MVGVRHQLRQPSLPFATINPGGVAADVAPDSVSRKVGLTVSREMLHLVRLLFCVGPGTVGDYLLFFVPLVTVLDVSGAAVVA